MKKIVILDTEYTAWKNSKERLWSYPGEHREIIQIGALKLDFENGFFAEKESFSILVKPLINKKLSNYIKDLTKISQEAIDHKGFYFTEAINLFFKFCEYGKLPVFSWGEEIEIINENCEINKITLPDFETGFFDIRKFFNNNQVEIKNMTSGTISKKFGETPSGHPHDAIHDSRSIMIAINSVIRENHIHENQFKSLFQVE